MSGRHSGTRRIHLIDNTNSSPLPPPHKVKEDAKILIVELKEVRNIVHCNNPGESVQPCVFYLNLNCPLTVICCRFTIPYREL